MRPLYKFIILGVISGVLSALSIIIISTLWAWGVVLFPGILFGLFIASLFKKKKREVPFFIGLSTLGYYCATYIAVGRDFDALIYSFMPMKILLAGAIGGLIMLLAFHFLLAKLNSKQLTFSTILSGILSFPFFLLGRGGFEAFFIIFIIWQTGMAAALGYCVEQNTKKNPAKKN